jgi:excisionase family DNA binding protein
MKEQTKSALMNDGVEAASTNSQLLASIVGKATSERALKVPDAANEFGCHPSTIYREVNSGRLNHYRVGNGIRFTREHIEEYRRSNTGNRLACSSQREREVLRLNQC